MKFKVVLTKVSPESFLLDVRAAHDDRLRFECWRQFKEVDIKKSQPPLFAVSKGRVEVPFETSARRFRAALQRKLAKNDKKSQPRS